MESSSVFSSETVKTKIQASTRTSVTKTDRIDPLSALSDVKSLSYILGGHSNKTRSVSRDLPVCGFVSKMKWMMRNTAPECNYNYIMFNESSSLHWTASGFGELR